MSTNYIMKCDDDTFVRVEAVLKELKIVSRDKDLYMGNLNMHHRPLRMGKWAVTFEVQIVYIYASVITMRLLFYI